MKINTIPVYYINMDADTEKRESTERVLSEMGFSKVTRVAGVPMENTRLGCTLAHAKALETALDANAGPFLIVEDDIAIRNREVDIDVPILADALYLGVSKWGLYNGIGHRRISIEQHSPSIFRIYNMLSAHAIVYFNPRYAETLLWSYEFYVRTHDVQDKANAELMKYWSVYAVADPMFYQMGINEPETNFVLPGPNAVGMNKAMLLK